MYPGDTRLVRVSGTYCHGVVATEKSTEFDVQVYGLASTPPLTRLNKKVTTRWTGELGRNEQKEHRFHVYRGMNVLVVSSIGFYEIHGQASFNTWMACKDTCLPSPAVVYHPWALPSANSNITIQKEEDLYIVVLNNQSTSVFNNQSSVIQVTVIITLDLVEYTPTDPGQSSLPNCSTSAEAYSCSISLPGMSSQKALISATIPDSRTWNETALVNWSCQSRVWVYIVICLPALLFLLAAIVILCIHWCSIFISRKRNAIPLPQLLGDASELDDELHGL